MPARRWLLQGLVQGVGFRHATRREALRLGLRGWVRNRIDGAVEAVALGNEAQLDALEHWLRLGPPGSCVSAIDVTALAPEDVARLDPPVPDGFRQAETVA